MPIKNFIIRPANMKLDGGAMFGIIPRPLWQKVAPPDSENRIQLALRLWLIQTPTKNILIDTGVGDYHGAKFEERFSVEGGQDPILAGLSSLNLAPEQITDVIISHLHFDHAGGLTTLKSDKFVSVFPKAKLHIHKKHFEYALNPTEKDAGSFLQKYFLPVIKEHEEKNLLVWHDGLEGDLIKDGELTLKFKISMGHTPFLMHAYNEKFIYLADLIPTSAHIHIPWVMAYDMSPGISATEKRKFLDFCIAQNLKIIFEHDPLFWGAKVTYDKAKDAYLCEEKYPNTNLGALDLNQPSV